MNDIQEFLRRIQILEGQVQELNQRTGAIPQAGRGTQEINPNILLGSLPASLKRILHYGFEWVGNQVNVKAKLNEGIVVDVGGVATKRKTDYGISCDADGLLILLEANQGLQVGASGLATKRKTGGGVDCDADGLFVTIDAPLQEEIEDVVGEMVTGNTETGIAVTYDDVNGKLDFDAQTAGDLRYAPIAKGVTNGDTHDHVGGDGAQIDHGGLAGLTDDDHTQYILHSLATAANDFLVASGAGAYVKKTLAETLTVLGKAAASGLASLDASTVVVEAVNRLLAGTGALTTNDGQIQWQSTRKIGLVYDSQRERAISEIGWLPYAYQIGGGPGDVVTTALTLTNQNDVVAIPVILESSMLLESVTIRQLDTATARTWRWGLYEQYLNNGNAAENSLVRLISCAATSFTPTAASNETAASATLPIYLPPGIYWLVIQNRHATSALTLGTMPAGTMALNTCQTKNVGSNMPDPLDFVAATWTKQSCIVGARLNGRVFGETTAF